MNASAHPSDINFVKVGAVAAFLLPAALVAAIVTFFALSDASARTETREFLDDVVDKRGQYIALVWLFTFTGLLRVPFALGLYYALRRWSEDYARVALLAGVVAAILHAMWPAPLAAIAAYIVPAWGEAGDEATRAILLSDASILAWVNTAMISVFLGTIGISFIAFSLVMLRIGQTYWTVLGWIGIGAGVFSILGAFAPAAEGFAFAGFIGVVLEINWFLGVGRGLWRGLPGEEALPNTAGGQ